MGHIERSGNVHGSEVGEPTKDLVGTDRETHVGESREARGDDEGDPGKTVSGDLGEDLGKVTVEGDTVKGSGRGVEIGRGGGPGGGDKTGVDQTGKTLDAGSLDGQDEGRGGSVAGGTEMLVVGSGDETDDECAEDVEETNSDPDLLDGSGQVSSRVLSLSSGL